MAGIGNSDGGNKLNIELNLVPFIDLLSTLVLFLLVTTVWLQISVIPASMKNEGTSSAPPSEMAKRLTIRVTSKSHELRYPDSIPALANRIERGKDDYRWEDLALLLKEIHTRDMVTAVAIAGDDDVDYGAVIKTIDWAKSSGLKFVGLTMQ